MRKIVDEFTDLPVSRERKRQLRKIKAGLCWVASCNEQIFKYGICQKHCRLERRRSMIYKRKKYGYKAWHAGGKGRPPLIA